MPSTFQKFKELHVGNDLFMLPNAWDARSAIIFAASGFPVVGTSSAAVANSLGLEDGENMSFEDYVFVIKKIMSSINVPLTVDLEMGYGKNDDEIANNACYLAELGVAGINIEDSFIDSEGRKMKDAVLFAKTINYMRATLKSKDLNLFINLRCDTHILNVPDAQIETIRRLSIYNDSAADGIFIPCIVKEKDIADVVAHSKLPLNVMCVPALPGIDVLNTLGVKRVSMGPFPFHKVYTGIGELSNAISSTRTFNAMFS
jgi:2-methylisocitrate lyase-like PEP mutase family enzyme